MHAILERHTGGLRLTPEERRRAQPLLEAIDAALHEDAAARASCSERLSRRDALHGLVAVVLDEETPLSARLDLLVDRIPAAFPAGASVVAEVRIGERRWSGDSGCHACGLQFPLRLGPALTGSLTVACGGGAEDPVHALLVEARSNFDAVALAISAAVRGELARQELERRELERKRQQNDRSRLELELQQAQRLEAVGQLASGIAHEINTPIQFIGDSIAFTQEAVQSLARLYPVHVELVGLSLAGDATRAAGERAAAIAEEEDLAFVLEQMPAVLQRARDGVDRVTRIVRAMKGFAHPATAEMVRIDLVQAIETTITVAWHEIKYVADIERTFGDVPLVLCYPGDVNQIVLNLLVNAAHAIGDVVGDTGAKGRITVRTWRDGRFAIISISDTGCGIPAAIRARVFEQFFTTKEVGRGTGQGLALVRGLVVDRHGGSIDFETEPGIGTTFHVRLPIEGPRAEEEAA